MCALAIGYFPSLPHIPSVTIATLQQESQKRLLRSDKKRRDSSASRGPCEYFSLPQLFEDLTPWGLYKYKLWVHWTTAQLKTSVATMF